MVKRWRSSWVSTMVVWVAKCRALIGTSRVPGRRTGPPMRVPRKPSVLSHPFPRSILRGPGCWWRASLRGCRGRKTRSRTRRRLNAATWNKIQAHAASDEPTLPAHITSPTAAWQWQQQKATNKKQVDARSLPTFGGWHMARSHQQSSGYS